MSKSNERPGPLPTPEERGYRTREEAEAYTRGVLQGQTAVMMLIGNALAKSQQEAMTDSLTETLNKRGFLRAVRETLVNNPNRKLAFFLIDLGNFKSVNDTISHTKGDEVLRQVSGNLRQGDVILGRLGGDEFGVLVDLDDVHEEVGRRMTYKERTAAIVSRLHGVGDEMRRGDQDLVRTQFFISVGAYTLTDENKLRATGGDAASVRALLDYATVQADEQMQRDKGSELGRLGFTAYRTQEN